MVDNFQDRLPGAVRAVLRPFIRLLLKSGISYKDFSEIAKEIFVAEATSESDSRGRLTNISRVAVRTALSRKEVARIRREIAARNETAGDERATKSDRSSHAARVLQLWHSDPRFVNDVGQPRLLPTDGPDRNFQELVRLAGGDVPLGAVRAELLAAGAVQELGDGTLQVLKRHFIPSDIGEELFVGLIHIVEPVLSGLAHNVLEQKSPPFIQRVAYSERLPSTAREVFRAFSNEAATDFVHDMDAWISANELPPEADVTDGHMAGIGVFFYEKRKPRDS